MENKLDDILDREIAALDELNRLTVALCQTSGEDAENIERLVGARAPLILELARLEKEAEGIRTPEALGKVDGTRRLRLLELTGIQSELEAEALTVLEKNLIALKNMTSNLDRTRRGLISYFGPQLNVPRHTDQKG